MSKAEQRALKAYPKATRDITGIVIDIGHPQYMRDLYIEGYNQAEKDNELTWEDIRKIVIIYENVLNDKDFNTLPIKDGYTEVLKRFKDLKK